MDPNATLEMIRTLVGRLQRGWTYDRATLEHYADQLAEHVEALDEWLSKGGFLPDEWQR